MSKNYCFIFFLSLTLMACKSEDKAVEESLIGVWDVYASKINKRDNDFVKNGWFEFLENKEVISNVFQDEGVKKFSIENQRLLIEMEPIFDLKINEFKNDSMHLEGKLSYYYMEYFLVKRQ